MAWGDILHTYAEIIKIILKKLFTFILKKILQIILINIIFHVKFNDYS